MIVHHLLNSIDGDYEARTLVVLPHSFVATVSGPLYTFGIKLYVSLESSFG